MEFFCRFQIVIFFSIFGNFLKEIAPVEPRFRISQFHFRTVFFWSLSLNFRARHILLWHAGRAIIRCWEGSQGHQDIAEKGDREGAK